MGITMQKGQHITAGEGKGNRAVSTNEFLIRSTMVQNRNVELYLKKNYTNFGNNVALEMGRTCILN